MEVGQAIKELCKRRQVPQLFKVRVEAGSPPFSPDIVQVEVVLTKNTDEGNWPWPSTYACEDADQAVQMAEELIVEWMKPELIRKGYVVFEWDRPGLWRARCHGQMLTNIRSTEAGAWRTAWKHYQKEKIA